MCGGLAQGTPLYMAPEMKESDEAKGPKVDVFSAGVVLVEMDTGAIPPALQLWQRGRRREPKRAQ